METKLQADRQERLAADTTLDLLFQRLLDDKVDSQKTIISKRVITVETASPQHISSSTQSVPAVTPSGLSSISRPVDCCTIGARSDLVSSSVHSSASSLSGQVRSHVSGVISDDVSSAVSADFFPPMISIVQIAVPIDVHSTVSNVFPEAVPPCSFHELLLSPTLPSTLHTMPLYVLLSFIKVEELFQNGQFYPC